jgi:pyruvate/2-oxoglutarate dehydrogenase complex dihydrolipoamide acyltransferase (E2) component
MEMVEDNMSQIYSKTAKGQEEIKTRAGGLTQRMRQVLIFIDGKRSRDDLFGMLKGDDFDKLLAELVALGLVEVTGSAASKPAAAPAAPAPVAAAAPAAAAAPRAVPKAPEPPKPNSEELERRRREEEEQAELLMARSFMGKMS